MPRSSRRIFVLLFVTALAATAARAQSPTDAALQLLRPADLLTRLWSLLAHPWNKNGCEFDPSGRCIPVGSAPTAGDNGCEVDPNGTTKNGCEFDPNGVTKNGCELDPDGRYRAMAKNGCELDPSGLYLQ